MSTDVILVHQSIQTEFLEALEQAAAALQAQTKAPPVAVSMAAAARIASVLDDATKKGGELLLGGALPPSARGTTMVMPSIIGGISTDMQLWKEEAFGPVAGFKLFSTDEEAIEVVNGSGYGLSASVFTRDLRKAFALAKRIETGYV